MAVTIKDVSAKCGLSISTVSKAFNNYAAVSYTHLTLPTIYSV